MSQVQPAVINTLGAFDQWMKTISANISGSAITGYRGSEVQFGEVLEDQISGPIRATDGFGSVNPIQHADSGAMVTGITTDFSQGSVTQTSNRTDLAVNGDAFFVVSKVPVPRSMEDLSFTRDGGFHFEFLQGPVAGSGTYRLVNKDGLFVMGWNAPVDNNNNNRPFGTPPQEAQGTDLNAFNTVAPNGAGNPGLGLQLQNIQLDLVRNPDALNNWAFDSQGLLRVNGDAPRDLANNQASMFVALTKFANPQALERDGGGAYFNYSSVAGQIFSGVAGTGNDGTGSRVVGSHNQLTSQALEQSNTSINTVMPELTLAQKSFSAVSKVMSVANGMIDDVNQLVK